MRNVYSKFSIKSFRVLSCVLFFLCDLGNSIYFYTSIKTDLSKVMDNQVFKDLLSKSLSEQGVELPPGIEGDIFTIFTQAMMLFLCLVVLFHIIIYVFYLYEKRFSYLYLRMVATFGALFCLFSSISQISTSALSSVLFLSLTLFYLFNFFGFFYFPILAKKSPGQ